MSTPVHPLKRENGRPAWGTGMAGRLAFHLYIWNRVYVCVFLKNYATNRFFKNLIITMAKKLPFKPQEHNVWRGNE